MLQPQEAHGALPFSGQSRDAEPGSRNQGAGVLVLILPHMGFVAPASYCSGLGFLCCAKRIRMAALPT